MPRPDPEDIAVTLLLEGLYQRHGQDFRDYARASIRRRITHFMRMRNYTSIAAMIEPLLADDDFCRMLVHDLTVNVSEMFRDASFYHSLRRNIMPRLQDIPHARVWLAGCASGEEAYSMAILFTEAGMAGRVRIYATDLNEQVLHQARTGIFPLNRLRRFTLAYQQGGGVESFADYYTADDSSAVFHHRLREMIVFAAHNLVTDAVFGEMHMVICRNVLIYFNRALRDRVLTVLRDSLLPGGYLCLGSKENLAFTEVADHFEEVDGDNRIYRKVV
ncbi:MAG: protein-glutamate O-methyltransferase CheR [Thermodesulfobacteriota bacterium]